MSDTTTTTATTRFPYCSIAKMLIEYLVVVVVLVLVVVVVIF